MKGENTMNSKIKDFLRKYTMVIALVIVFILFCALTDGRLLFAQNMSNLMLQNGYVLVLACGMLLCILTQHHKLKEKMERNLFAGSFHCVKI